MAKAINPRTQCMVLYFVAPFAVTRTTRCEAAASREGGMDVLDIFKKFGRKKLFY